MRNSFRKVLVGLAVAAGLPLAAAAPAPAVVDAVQSPAFLTRGNVTRPLQPGQDLRNGDLISTGEGAKAYLKLAEGSMVKLGASAKINFYSSGTRPDTFYRGALDVLTGAFRFTTGLLARTRQRDVRIRVGTATVGIRGTDVWGRSTAEKDLVCLIEGHVQVRHPSLDDAVDMSEAMTFFVADKGVAPAPVAPVDPAQLKEWASETDILPGAAAISATGRSLLRLGDAGSEADALNLYDRASAAGYPARINVLPGDAGYVYQVVIGGMVSRDAARRMAEELGRQLGLAVRVVR